MSYLLFWKFLLSLSRMQDPGVRVNKILHLAIHVVLFLKKKTFFPVHVTISFNPQQPLWGRAGILTQRSSASIVKWLARWWSQNKHSIKSFSPLLWSCHVCSRIFKGSSPPRVGVSKEGPKAKSGWPPLSVNLYWNSKAAFTQQSWIVKTEMVWPEKPELFIIWRFT